MVDSVLEVQNIKLPDSGGVTSSTAITLDASGNVGIGGSPSYPLDVKPTTAASDVVGIFQQGSYPSAVIKSGSGYVDFGNGASGAYTNIRADGTSGSVRFQTVGTERMRIDSSGNLLVGKTSADDTTVGTTIYSTNGFSSVRNNSVVAILNRLGSDGDVMQFRKDSTTVGRITLTSSTTTYATSSDYRLKTDVQPMSGATERLKALNPVNFAWKVDGSRVDGFLAHEAAEVVPEAVTGTKDAMRTEEYEVTPAVLDNDGNVVTEAVMGTREVPDYQGIDQAKLVPLLTAALQEAVSKIEVLTARIEVLENAAG